MLVSFYHKFNYIIIKINKQKNYFLNWLNLLDQLPCFEKLANRQNKWMILFHLIGESSLSSQDFYFYKEDSG